MTRKAVLGAQVKNLLSNVSEHSTQHLDEIQTDLTQTSILLGEAIEKLSASFMAIHKAVTEQQQNVDRLLTDASATPEAIEKIRVMQGEIGQHINAAVTGLQFQDMTGQLIGRAARRVTGLRDVLNSVETGSAGILDDSSDEDIKIALAEVGRQLEECSVKLESELWKAVCQTHMESGDVELF